MVSVTIKRERRREMISKPDSDMVIAVATGAFVEVPEEEYEEIRKKLDQQRRLPFKESRD